jgi:prevent-host-death family protein
MTTVSMFEAKTNLSRYVASVVDHQEPYIVITRSGKPVAKIVPFTDEETNRIGLAEGKLPSLSSLEDFNSIITEDEFTRGGIL